MKKIIEAKYTSLEFDEQVMTAKEIGLECFAAKVSLASATMTILGR
jgi:hypothetical protein